MSKLALCLLVWAFPYGSLAAALVLEGAVSAVPDGDSLSLRAGGRGVHRIRLSGIDAPELDQAFGQAAQRQLKALALHRPARAVCHKQDRYGRQVCRVWVAGRDLGLAQIEAGLAWWYVRYAHELAEDVREAYATAQGTARRAGLGLWQEARPLEPWRWRQLRQGVTSPGPPAIPPG